VRDKARVVLNQVFSDTTAQLRRESCACAAAEARLLHNATLALLDWASDVTIDYCIA
jgi:hypothetical protein